MTDIRPAGLLVGGSLHLVPGAPILAPLQQPWNRLVRGKERAGVPQFKVLHKTLADDPESITDEPGPPEHWGGAEETIRGWAEHVDRDGKPDPKSGTHLVTGHDGRTACTADLLRYVGWHCHTANDRSWGHEIKEHRGGLFHSAALLAAVVVTMFDMSLLGVQWQCPIAYKRNVPLPRLEHGGADCVGAFGHRDCTGERNEHDPGDIVPHALAARGFERWDFYAGQDLHVWGARQTIMARGGYYRGKIDGVPFHQTRDALLAMGYPFGIFARWPELLELPPLHAELLAAR